MRSTGIQRKVDDLGRVVIPAGIRRSLGIREGDALDVAVDGSHVILSKPADRCVFCGSEEALRPFQEKVVCHPCLVALGGMADTVKEQTLTAASPAPPAPPEPPRPSNVEDLRRFDERYRDVDDPASSTAW